MSTFFIFFLSSHFWDPFGRQFAHPKDINVDRSSVNNHEVICAGEEFLVNQNATFFRTGIAMFEYRLNKWIYISGDYIEY